MSLQIESVASLSQRWMYSSLPMGQLVGFQSFRIFVELVLHLGYSQG